MQRLKAGKAVGSSPSAEKAVFFPKNFQTGSQAKKLRMVTTHVLLVKKLRMVTTHVLLVKKLRMRGGYKFTLSLYKLLSVSTSRWKKLKCETHWWLTTSTAVKHWMFNCRLPSRQNCKWNYALVQNKILHQKPHVLQPYSMQETTRRTPPYVQPLHLAVEAITGSSSVISRSFQNLLNRTNFLGVQNNFSVYFLFKYNLHFQQRPPPTTRRMKQAELTPWCYRGVPLWTHVTNIMIRVTNRCHFLL